VHVESPGEPDRRTLRLREDEFLPLLLQPTDPLTQILERVVSSQSILAIFNNRCGGNRSEFDSSIQGRGISDGTGNGSVWLSLR
jgi:hypothetical protein